MKIITLQKIGYNHPSQANWSYTIWSIGLIDTDNNYCMAHTVKDAFGQYVELQRAVEQANTNLKYKFKEFINIVAEFTLK